MNVVLIVAIVVVSGVVAYVGDVIGKRLGKKRVSVLGLRPRQTAVLIAVTTACLITLGTIGAVALASKSARVALFQLDELYGQIDEAERQADDAKQSAEKADREKDDALRELEQSSAELDLTKAGLQSADRARTQALERATEAAEVAAGAEADAGQARDDLSQASAQVDELRGQQDRLQDDVLNLEAARQDAEEQRDAVVLEAGRQHFEGNLPLFGYSSDLPPQRVALPPDQELARAILPTRSDSTDAIRALSALLEDATRAAETAGTGTYDFPGDGVDATNGLTLILLDAEVRPGPDWRFYNLDERNDAYDAYLARVADRAAGLAGRGSVYILARVGPYAVPRNRPAIIELELGLVKPAQLPVGAVLATVSIPQGTTKNAIAEACTKLVDDARERVRGTSQVGGIYRGIINPDLIPGPTYAMVEEAVTEAVRLHEDLNLDARLACVVIADPTWPGTPGPDEYLNTDVPRYRIDVEPAL